MYRGLTAIAALTALVGCRPYNGYDPLVDDSGMVSGAQYARYGAEQAQVVAIGRSLAQWYGGPAGEARGSQAMKAAEYARSLPGVVNVVPDTLGYRLTVTFKSGWTTAVVPIADGVQPEHTRGLPGAQ